MGFPKHYNKIPFRELKDEALEANGTGGFLTKPCPLMDEGKWYWAEVKLVCTDSTTDPPTYSVSRTYSEELPSGIICGAQTDYGNIYVSADATSDYKFGEVRLTCEHYGDNNVNDIPIQGDKGWSVGTTGTQRYYGLGSTTYFRYQRGTNYWKFFFYLVPKEHSAEVTE